MRKRRAGVVFVVLGAVLILSALLLFLHNEEEAANAGEAANAALREVQTAIREYEVPPKESDAAQPEETAVTPQPLTAVNINGYNYIGYIAVPNLELELPIMEECDYTRLQIAPCLQFGSPLTDDAVIAGHNYKQHFLPLHDIQVGEYVTFTDMTGGVIEYSVAEVKTMDPTLVDEVENSGYDLVLYTCTIGGRTRVVVYCERLVDIAKYG